MSVAKRKGSPFYYYKFVVAGRRFRGSTGTANKRDAEEVERRARAAATAEERDARTRDSGPVTLKMACDRYWIEIGQHHKAAAATRWSLEWLLAELGEGKLLRDIGDSDVARIVAKRRGDTVVNVARDGKTSKRRRRPAAGAKRLSPARVNRSVTEPLRKVMLRARKAWGETVREINWKEHLLKEPRERVRSLTEAEERRLFTALPAQYHPIITVMLRMGLREAEACALTWGAVDWGDRTLTVRGKGDKVAVLPMPDDIRDLLWDLQAPGGDRVFRYRNNQPLTRWGLISAFRRAREAADLRDFRVHDLRHTAATRLLKDSGGNLKMVSRLLRHEDITTTARYAHVFDEDLREAMNASYRKRDRTGKKDSAAAPRT